MLYALLFLALLFYALLFHALLSRVLLLMLCSAVSSFAVLYYSMLCCPMPLYQSLFHTFLLHALLLHDCHSFLFCSIYTAPCLCSLLQASLVYTSPPHSSLLQPLPLHALLPMLCGFTYDWPILHYCMIRCFMPRFYILCCASCLTAPCFMLHFSVLYVASCVCRSMHAVCKFMLNSFSPVVMLFHASLFLVHCSYFAKPYLTAPCFTAPCFILCCSKLDTNPCFMLLHISCFSLLDASL